MTCEETRILVHALIDGELDAGHASEVEAHVASCPGCAVQLRDYRVMRQALAAPALRHQAPAALRARIEGALPSRRAIVSNVVPSRRSLYAMKFFTAAGCVSSPPNDPSGPRIAPNFTPMKTSLRRPSTARPTNHRT